MRVYINNYRNNWVSPYTIMKPVAAVIRCFRPKFDLYEDGNEKWTDWLTRPCRVLQSVLDVVRPKINYVKIDRWDTWNMDHTVALIVLPMLKQLQATKHGAPCVDDNDVPEHLRSTAAPPKEYDWDTDDNHFLRWDWVLDEMIFAFECELDDSWEEAFRTGEIDWMWTKSDETYTNPETGKEEQLSQMVKGPNHTYECDYEGMKVVQARIQNGFRLFGTYYRHLWD
jgi:hypothetical protein